MKPRDIVRLPKSVTSKGQWKVVTGTARMAPGAFRLSKRASYQVARHWHWRVDELEGGGMHFRLLTAFRPETEEYLAWLSMPTEEGLRVLARFEFHGTHPGWHVHTACEDHEDIPVSDQAPRIFRRAPAAHNTHRRMDFVTSERAAVERALRFFRVKPPADWTLES